MDRENLQWGDLLKLKEGEKFRQHRNQQPACFVYVGNKPRRKTIQIIAEGNKAKHDMPPEKFKKIGNITNLIENQNEESS